MTNAKFSNEDMAIFRELLRGETEKSNRRDGSSRVNFQEEERKYWEGWLPKDLGQRAGQIKLFVKRLYAGKKTQRQMRHYTPHDIAHCKAVEDNMHRLIPNELHKKFSESEKFL